MAVDLGQDKVKAMAEKFGFNDSSQDVPVRAYPSVYPSDMDESSTALTGIGQYDVTATPLQMAMVSAAIANGGKLVSPHMVSQTSDASGDVVKNYDDSAQTKEIVSSTTAEQLQSAMQTVVTEGTGTNAKISGATVGGKTGTAQHGEKNSKTPYAWFTSYAKSDSNGKEVAVAVIVEQSDAARSEVSGNGLAAPVAKAMMRAALKN
jgi:cell division protein FtsI/penicillin-binding protein 2